MDRRDFLKAGLVLGGAAALGALPRPPRSTRHPVRGRHSVLDGPPGDSGIDTIVICMMENRSFDSYLGWLAATTSYLEHGRSLYGANFAVNGNSFQQLPGPGRHAGRHVPARAVPRRRPVARVRPPRPGPRLERRPRRARRRLPRARERQRHLRARLLRGAKTSRCTSALARRFIVCDDWHASVLGPTYPNREYLMSGQSGGNKTNDVPADARRLRSGTTSSTASPRAGVSGRPSTTATSRSSLLWGSRMNPHVAHRSRLTTTTRPPGNLPNVSFVTPSFVGDERAPTTIRTVTRAPRSGSSATCSQSFAKSPHWHNGLFVLTYDEWGGFFDHVAPPHLRRRPRQHERRR